MIKITDGKTVIAVTHGAFDGIYRSLGFRPYDGEQLKPVEIEVEDVSVEEKAAEVEEADEAEEEAIFPDEILEKPISQWTKANLKQYADFYGLDISNAKKVEEVREIVKQHMYE